MFKEYLKDYKKLEYPIGTEDGPIFGWSTGSALDRFGDSCGIDRRKFWIFKEPDSLYKTRLRNYGIERWERQIKKLGENK